MARRTRSARAVLHARLIRFRIGDEFPQIIGRQILAREQDQRRLSDQHDGREIGRGVVERSFIERLICGMGADIAEHELIAVRRRLRHARSAGHAARAAHILDDDLLPQKLGKAGGQNASDRVCRTTGSERNDHRHWPGGPVLR